MAISKMKGDKAPVDTVGKLCYDSWICKRQSQKMKQ